LEDLINKKKKTVIDSDLLNDFESIFYSLPGNHLLIKADPPKFTIISANKSYFQMVGRSKDSVLGKGVFEVFPPGPLDPSAAEQLKASFLEVIQTKKVHFLPVQRYDLSSENDEDFKEKFWRIRNTPVVESYGNVKFIINSVEDITNDVLSSRKEKELGSLVKTHNLFLQAPVAIQIYRTPDFRIELVNEPTLKIWGKSASEVIGKTLVEVLPELKGEGFIELMMEVAETCVSKSFYELPVNLYRNGEMVTCWFNFTYTPYYENNDAKPAGILVFSEEVTDKVISRKLTQANLVLKEKNKELERFAYVASHDLQEPLRKVSFFIQLLEENLKNVDELSKSYIKKINSSTFRMSELIKDLLDFSRLVTDIEQLSPVDLNAVIRNSLNDFEILIQQTDAAINVSEMPVVNAIPIQMRQLFHNLISNALKFRIKGVKPVVSITSKRITAKKLRPFENQLPKHDYYSIKISDNGIGFSPENSEKIFGIFHRLHSKQQFEGTGIGLAICRKIVENHHGTIKAVSSENQGATFEVLLPD